MQLIVDGITVLLSNTGVLSILLGVLSLVGGSPVVDGTVYRNAPMQIVQQSSDEVVADYDLGASVGQMRVTISAVSSDTATVQYSMRNVPLGRSFSTFGIRFDSIGGLKRYYRSGYHSWDGSYFVQPEELRRLGTSNITLDRGYGLTELIPSDGTNALVMGFDRHDRYQQSFTFSNLGSASDLTILTWWDQKLITGQEAASENLYLLRDLNYEEGLRRWARIAAAKAPIPPRTKTPPVIGWDSWYNLYNFISEPLIREALQGVSSVTKQTQLPMQTFLIDSGFVPELGDWLTTDYAFPNGMQPLLKEIKDAGFTPGLWIAPLLVGNRSQLYKNHPDWVLKNRATNAPNLLFSFYGEYRLGLMRSEEYYVLDLTNPPVMDYLRTVFRTWRRDWGVQVFKIDASVFGLDWGPDQISYNQPGSTRIEVWRKFAEMVRTEIGDDAIWMGSGEPLWASIGLSDTIRIGGDVGVDWSGTYSAQSLLRDLPTRNFTNNILWQADPDAVLLRNQYNNLSDTEVRSLALFDAISGGVMTTGDNLAQVSSDRLDLWKSVLSTSKASASYPLLGRENILYVPYQDPASGVVIPVSFLSPLIVQVRDNGGGSYTVHVLNTSTDRISRNLSLQDLGIQGGKVAFDWMRKQPLPGTVQALPVTLDAHSSALLILSNPAQSSARQGTNPN